VVTRDVAELAAFAGAMLADPVARRAMGEAACEVAVAESGVAEAAAAVLLSVI